MKRAKSENDDDEVKPYLSGAYIRSFVKQLASSRSNCSSSSSSMRENVERETAAEAEADAKPQKKQVRRRLQTRKPYQEKLLNMAEARREIVSALKLHRAAMKHQQEIIDQKSRRNPRIYASNADVAAAPYWPPPPPPPEDSFLYGGGLDFALPSQTLGLNLNLHDFVTVPSSSIYSSSSPSPSPPPPPPPPPPIVGQLPHAERFEFLNGVESVVINGGEGERESEEMVSSPFDEVMEFPPWLNANESCFQHVDDFAPQDFFQGSVLPCMEIEEIEGMDGDWLA